ncbi:hypothetical protein EVAR_63058_1 [Eumeta japonica]|uniref:Uncharacterized protein n=1 Tax=Eumeta variegata TaxID=151549 RepID=A0A4C1Z8D7_EUMVA|nr:hypothetical protein EVAR_63058_1 [Eumeta japonica]
MDACREHHEHSLLQIQTLQAELHSNRLQKDKLQHEMDMHKVDETLDVKWHPVLEHAADVHRILFCKSGPFAQFTGRDLVYLLEMSYILQEAGNTLVTPLELQVSMGGADHLSDDSPAIY